MKACTQCKRLTNSDTCEICKVPTSDNWSGLLIITDPEASELGKELNIELPGEYCLIVR